IARHLVAGEGFVATSYRSNPIMSFYLAGVFRLFGEQFLYARIGQALFGALTCVLVAATATRLVGPAVGVVSGVLLAVYLPHVYLSGVFYVECLFTMLVALTVYLAARCLDGRHPVRWGLLTGLSLGLASLTRPVFIVYLPAVGVALLYGAWPRWRPQLVAWGAAVLATVAVVSPWAIRNHEVYGRPILISTGFGTKLWQGNNELSVGDADDRELSWDNDIWARRAAQLDEGARRALDRKYAEIGDRGDAAGEEAGDFCVAGGVVLLPRALGYVRPHPVRPAPLFSTKREALFPPSRKLPTTTRDAPRRNQTLATITFWPMIVLAVVGACVGF